MKYFHQFLFEGFPKAELSRVHYVPYWWPRHYTAKLELLLYSLYPTPNYLENEIFIVFIFFATFWSFISKYMDSTLGDWVGGYICGIWVGGAPGEEEHCTVLG